MDFMTPSSTDSLPLTLTTPHICECKAHPSQKNITVDEKNRVLFSVIKIAFVQINDTTELSIGTGFLWKQKNKYYLITNKHVAHEFYRDQGKDVQSDDGFLKLYFHYATSTNPNISIGIIPVIVTKKNIQTHKSQRLIFVL